MCEQRRPVTSRDYKRTKGELEREREGQGRGGEGTARAGGKDTGHWDNGTPGHQKQLCILSMGIKLAVASQDATRLDSTPNVKSQY